MVWMGNAALTTDGDQRAPDERPQDDVLLVQTARENKANGKRDSSR